MQRRLSDVVASLETPVAPLMPVAPTPVEATGASAPPAAAPPPAPHRYAAHPEPVDTAALDEARRRAAEQREAFEAMLREAQLLEQRIAAEAAAELREAEQRAIQEGERAAARALAVEQHAAAQAATLQERMDRMVAERKAHEVQADAVRVTERKAQAEVDARQAALEDALKTAATAAITVTEVDRVVVGYAKREDLLRKEIDQLTARVTEQREVREAAEVYAREAEERLAQLGGDDVGRTSIEEIQAIEARLSEQLEAAQRVTHAVADAPAQASAAMSSAAATASGASSNGEAASGATMPHVA
ncbi:MAG: hypothetical protein ABI186_02040 [Candidatus Elarobacter sp.]